VVVGATATYVQYDAGKKAQKSQQAAQAQALTVANAQADQADQANNRANMKRPNLQGLLSENQMAAKGGVGGTMLTGPEGVDQDSLLLGKNTLLGG
jgi:hypothetical protein